MKKLARGFIILSIVLGFWMIFPIVFGAIALRKLDSAKTPREIVGWGVVTLFFVSQVAGVLMLIMDEEDLQGKERSAEKDKYFVERAGSVTKVNTEKTAYEIRVPDIKSESTTASMKSGAPTIGNGGRSTTSDKRTGSGTTDEPVKNSAFASSPPKATRQAGVSQNAEKLDGTKLQSMQTELLDLFRMRQGGLISVEEYEAIRRDIMKRYYGENAR